LFNISSDANSIIKRKYKKYHTVGTVPKFKKKKEERGKIDTPRSQVNDGSLFCLGTGNSIKSGGVKL
jgi:hypothetical protein